MVYRNNLFSQGKIGSEVVGVYYAPATSANSGAGELSFGGGKFRYFIPTVLPVRAAADVALYSSHLSRSL